MNFEFKTWINLERWIAKSLDPSSQKVRASLESHMYFRGIHSGPCSAWLVLSNGDWLKTHARVANLAHPVQAQSVICM
jgi:hypothetical protein